MVDYQIDANGTKTRTSSMLLGLLTLLILGGCSHWQAIAERDQLLQRRVQGTAFTHRVLWNQPASARLTAPTTSAVIWHVYIEGDGHAVNLFGQPSADPTPIAPILLSALGVDAAPALYLGRPCYFDTNDPPCSPAQWTLERYSQQTVDSLLAAARALIPPQDKIVLIGHSGGGTLATLLAARLPQTCAVITLAGNLDVGRWISSNQYTPLPDSLDPSLQPPLAPAITQWHFAGADDRIILPSWIQAFSDHQPGSHFQVLAKTNHITPWQQHLVESLKALQNQTRTGLAPGKAPLLPALDNSQSVCGKVTG